MTHGALKGTLTFRSSKEYLYILLYLLLVFVTYDLKPVLHIVEVEIYTNLAEILAASPRESILLTKYEYTKYIYGPRRIVKDERMYDYTV